MIEVGSGATWATWKATNRDAADPRLGVHSLGVTVESDLRRLVVLERKENGGAVIEVPILVTGSIDLAKTAGRGSRTISLEQADLETAAKNVRAFGRPMPVSHGPHKPMPETQGPAEAFIDSLEARDGELVARMTLNAFMAFLVVDEEAFRGFSVDMAENPELPDGKISGFVILGGVFTNRPATQVNFRVAASMQLSQHFSFSTSTPRAGAEVLGMELQEQVASLTASLAEANGKVETLTVQLSERPAGDPEANAQQGAKISALEGTVEQLSTKLAAAEAKTTAARIVELRKIACSRKGQNPAMFDGVDTDPLAWLEKQPYDVDQLGVFIEGLADVAVQTSIASGASATPADAPVKLEAEIKRVAADQSISMAAATESVRLSQPDLFRAGTAAAYAAQG